MYAYCSSLTTELMIKKRLRPVVWSIWQIHCSPSSVYCVPGLWPESAATTWAPRSLPLDKYLTHRASFLSGRIPSEPSAGLRALCCSHQPLHVINQTSQPNKSTSKNSKMTIYFGLTLIVENTVYICGISCHHAIPVCSSFSTCSCFSMSLRISIT